MQSEDNQRVMDELGTILELEKAALLDGALDRVGAIMARKEDLVERLNALSPRPIKEMETLRHKVMRNQDLLDGALEGIRAVASRIAAVHRIRSTLETYDRSGRKSNVSGVIEHEVEKRA